MHSMTGFGRGSAEKDKRKVTVDIKSVNHKVFDLLIKTPRTAAFCDDSIRKICKQFITRGHVEVFVNYTDSREERSNITVDVELAKKYAAAAKTLAENGITDDITASVLLKMPDVVGIEPAEDDEEEVVSLVKAATEEACKNLVAAREKEGEALKKELCFRLENLKSIVNEIEERAPLVAENYAMKLRQRMEEILSGVEIDESRFLTEVACFVDKSNIDEEITRLKTHVEYGFALLNSSAAIGKNLDFLVQEINREINTTGSKSNDIVLTQKVLAAKNELEKFREQVQNIE